MKKSSFPVGVISIGWVSAVMFLLQIILTWHFYSNQGASAISLACSALPKDAWAIYCLLPHWVCFISSALHFGCLCASVVAHTHFGRWWWYFSLPLVSVVVTTIVVVMTPLIYIEAVK